MSRRLAAAALAPLLLLPGVSPADTSIGLRAGSLGLGVEIAYAVSQRVALRLGTDAYTRNFTSTQQDIEYEGKAKLKTTSLMMDLFPFANNFRISLGAVLNGNKVIATGKPTGGTFTIDNVTYNAADVGTLDGEVTFKRTVPYFGIGYGRPINSGFSFIGDLGVIFQGSPKATLTATCSPTATPGNCNTLQSNVPAEEATLNDNIKNYKYYPVLTLGLSYTF